MNTAKTNRDKASEVINLSAGLITLDIEQRVKTLDSILRVYQGNFPFVRLNLGPKEEERLAKANKAGTLACGGATLDERETAYITAIRIYETVYASITGWKAVHGHLDGRLEELASKRQELMSARLWAERMQKELEERFHGLLSLLTTVFADFGVTFKVSSSQAKPRTFNASKEIVFGLPYLESIQHVDPVKVVFDEAHTVARALSVVRDAGGNAVVNTPMVNNLFPQITEALYKLTQRRGMVFKLQVERTEVVKPSEKQRAWAHVPTVGNGGGIFRPGSYLSMLYDRLVACPGITFTNLFDGIPAKDPERMFQTIAERGLVSNQFTLTRKGERITFTFIKK
jgi:hypothetical protein